MNLFKTLFKLGKTHASFPCQKLYTRQWLGNHKITTFNTHNLLQIMMIDSIDILHRFLSPDLTNKVSNEFITLRLSRQSPCKRICIFKKFIC